MKVVRISKELIEQYLITGAKHEYIIKQGLPIDCHLVRAILNKEELVLEFLETEKFEELTVEAESLK